MYYPVETCIDKRPLFQPERWNMSIHISFISARCIMTGGHSSPPYVNRKNKFTVVLQATKICTFILLLFTKLMILFV